MYSALTSEINTIGKRLIRCGKQCNGIVNKPEEGIFPHCLILETDKRSRYNPCVIVGLNPGHASADERTYMNSNRGYKSFISYWKDKKYNHPYYKNLRDLAEIVSLTGPILWTEIVKCECNKDTIPVPMHTISSCMKEYLFEELKKVDESWPLIGAGKKAYFALAYCYPGRTVIGVPHPTGSHGDFGSFINNEALKETCRSSLKNPLIRYHNRAIWLPDVIKET